MKSHKTIYVLSTGGTIAMHESSNGYSFVRGDLQKSLHSMPELQNSDMPNYVLHEYEQLLDSANMTPLHWMQIADHIYKNDKGYDGFVILHGTDTMAYTASALSFMLENLKKPVILTGSQLPLFKTRSDARENLINALWIAGNYSLPEVCIYFNNQLFRGNRSKKIDANRFAAFESPNFPLLGEIGAEIIFRQDLVRHSSQEKSLRLQEIQQTAIGTLRLFPGMVFDTLTSFCPSLKALVLETYGVGTAPEDPQFINWIKQMTANGTLVVSCSQCIRAKVKISDYTTGTALLNAGVIPAADMTIEAAITKLYYLFSKYTKLDDIKEQFILDLRGELTC